MRLRSLAGSFCLFAFCTGAFAQQEPIRIGVSIAQSPPGSVVQGTQIRDGAEIVKEMINRDGGVLGRPLEIVYEDNQGVPERGRAAVEKLIARDSVIAVTGGHQSSVCLAEIEVVKRYGTPYINTNCWSDDIRKKGYAEVFNPANYNSRVSSAMAETIAAMGVKRVIAFAENTDYGIGQAKLIAEFLKEKGPDVQFKYETTRCASGSASTSDGERLERVPASARKAWRWSGEMEEIAASLVEAGLPGGFHQAAAEVFQRLERFKDADSPPSFADLLAVLEQGGQAKKPFGA